MEYKGFVGPTYQARSASVSADRCVNWQAETIPTGDGKSSINYYPTPGLIQHADASARGIGRGAFAINGRQFAVCGDTLWEFDAAGNLTNRGGGMANDNGPVYFAANSKTPSQIMIASGGLGYLFDTVSETGVTVAQITGGLEPDGVTPGTFNGAAMCAFLDGYLIALNPTSRNTQISAINEGLNWSGLDVSANNGSADYLVGIITDHDYLYQGGNRRITVYANSGNADYPITPVSGAVIEQGLLAAGSMLRGDNTLFFLGQNEAGGAVAYRVNGFIPKPISTPATEYAWSKYPTCADATAYFVQRNGHPEYRITFPSGDATWVYDLATGMWHERASFVSATGTLHAQTQRYHCYSNGVHYFVGIDGIIYREDDTTYTEAGRPLKRLRTGPVVYNANKRMFVTRLEIIIQPGIGLDGDPTQQGANPQLVLRYSGDSGGTWSYEMTASGGLFGDAEARVIFDQLGSGRAWIPEISTTDPNNWVLIGAEIDVIPGTS